MKNNLDITFNLVAHPYPEDISSQFDVWGQIDVNVRHTIDGQLIPLLGIQWDIAAFAEWFVDNWLSICKDSLTIGNVDTLVLRSESIAEAMRRLQNRQFPMTEDEAQFKWFSSLFNFRETHSLRFALRGTDIPEIFVGYNHDCGEISCTNSTETWSYYFDMIDFCSYTRKNLQVILAEWVNNSLNRTATDRILTLITRLQTEIDCGCC